MDLDLQKSLSSIGVDLPVRRYVHQFEIIDGSVSRACVNLSPALHPLPHNTYTVASLPHSSHLCIARQGPSAQETR